MARVATLPAPDIDELDRATKKQKREAQTKARKEKLEKRDILLQSIPPLPKYQPIIIKYRPAVSHLSSNIFFTPHAIFSLIWTPTV